jgi:hypothetical protein
MEFLYSDDPFSVFLSIVIIIILFIISLNIIMGIVDSVGKSNEVYIIKGISPGNISMTIPVNPNSSGSKPIERSNNKTGIEFSWSVWLNISDIPTTSIYQHVFSKGEGSQDATGKVLPNNAPGLYITQRDNKCNLVVLMNTFGTPITDELTVPNVPLNKWINVIIRVISNSIDIYMNGSLVKSHELTGVPRQNYGDISVSLASGFNGYISNLIYFPYGLSPGKIRSISDNGPNLKISSSVNSLKSSPSYLSSKWYSDNINVY